MVISMIFKIIATPVFLVFTACNILVYLTYRFIHWINNDSVLEREITEDIHKENMDNFKAWFTSI